MGLSDPIGGQVNALVGACRNNLSWGLSLSSNGNIMAVGTHEYIKILPKVMIQTNQTQAW